MQVKSYPQAVNGVPWNLLNAEKWRLVTFAQYPHTAKKSAILLANGGFAYYGSGRDSDDTVICYFCARLKRGWLSSDDIQKTHRNLSPDCCMVTGADCNSIPMTVPVNGETLFFQFYNPNNANKNVSMSQEAARTHNTHIQPVYSGALSNTLSSNSSPLNLSSASKGKPATSAQQENLNNISTEIVTTSSRSGAAVQSSASDRQHMTEQTATSPQHIYQSIQNPASAVGATAPTNQSANHHTKMHQVLLKTLADLITKEQQMARSNSSILDESSATVIANKTLATAQGSINNIYIETAAASSRPGAAVQTSASVDRQHVTEQIASSPPSHANQSSQNSISAIGATAPTVEATAPTVGATAPTVVVTAPSVGATEPTVGVTAPTVGAIAPTVGATAITVGATAPTVGPTAPTVGATGPTVGATAPTVGATAPTIVVTAPLVEATEPTVGATAPTVGATGPTVGATAPSVGATEPMVGVTAPTVGATAITVGATAPTVGATAPTVGATAPTVAATAPTVVVTAPSVGATEPMVGVTAPTLGATAITVGATAPTVGETAPTVGAAAPTVGATAPTVAVTAPTVVVTAPSVGATAPTLGATAPTVGATAPTVAATASTVGATAPTVGATAPTVGATAPTVGATGPTVGATGPTVGATAPTVGATASTVGATASTVGATAPTVGATAPTVGATAPTVGATAPTVGATAPTVGATTPTVGAKASTVGATTPTVGATASTVGATAPTVGATASTVGATAPTVGVTAPTVGATAPIVGATASTVGATAPTNQSANQPQGNSSEFTTGGSQNTGQSNNEGPAYGELGIITERPKRFEYAMTATRVASFENWPRDCLLKKEDLSEAGFYYAGYGDCARCFHCGVGLRKWKDGDNVWVEHARWSPKCSYLRKKIGQQFVDTVQDLRKICDMITFTMVTCKMNSSSFQQETASSRPGAAVQSSASADRQHVTEQTATSPPPHVNQSTHNSAPAVGAIAPTVGATALTVGATAPTVGATAVTNRRAYQPQGNSSESTTSSSQNTGQSDNKGPTYGELGIITERPKRSEYAEEAIRFASFEHWPRDHPVRKEDMAVAGFYYAGNGDCARCFYCGGGLRNWEDGENVWVEHARWFPKCAHVRQTMGQHFVDTVQELKTSCQKMTFTMVFDKMRSSASVQRETASSRPGATVQSLASADRQHVTEQTAILPPPPHIYQSTQNSAAAVGATAPTVGATAATNWRAYQPQGNSSESTTGSSQNTGQSDNEGPTYGELGINTERPKRSAYAVEVTRFASFEHWPRDHPVRKEDLAAAGFYYAGNGDCARCFYCGGGLRNWEDGENVWVEHARWFPECAHVRQTMGQHFVDTVQELKTSCQKITIFMVFDKMRSSASVQRDTRNMPLQREPAVLAVVYMDYCEKDVIEAANYVIENYDMLSSRIILKKLEKVEDARGDNDSFAESNSSNIKQNNEKEMKKLKEENYRLRQLTVCKICMDREVAVVFLPCGHFVSCTVCAEGMIDCPICRKRIRKIMRAFLC